ncbi:MAG: alpha-ketoglutarate-dependent dioxygenase AlkB [Pseudomonadota bacterium]
MDDLFQPTRPPVEALSEGLVLLADFADATQMLRSLPKITNRSPFRHMQTPGGKPISVAVTNCGAVGWVSDRRGYRYQPIDPTTGETWPALPAAWTRVAVAAAEAAGFGGFAPNACLINRYRPGNQLTAHQDKNEGNFDPPVVTVSTGLPAEFLVWGETRQGSPLGVPVYDGDVIVMGGPARLHYHGVKRLKSSNDLANQQRISLTFREVDLNHAWQ